MIGLLHDSAMRMIRVLLADPQRSGAEALALRLDVESEINVVAVTARPADVPDAVRRRRVDVAVLAVDDAEGAFVALGEGLRAAWPGLRLVAVSGVDDVELLARAVRQGFRAWVPRDVGVADLLHAITAVEAGGTCIPSLLLSPLLEQLLQQQRDQRTLDGPCSTLTRREQDVLREMTRGATRAEIAQRLLISPNTVRTHTQRILAKLDVHTSLEAVTLARRAGVH